MQYAKSLGKRAVGLVRRKKASDFVDQEASEGEPTSSSATNSVSHQSVSRNSMSDTAEPVESTEETAETSDLMLNVVVRESPVPPVVQSQVNNLIQK